jgi:hypothetical protein
MLEEFIQVLGKWLPSIVILASWEEIEGWVQSVFLDFQTPYIQASKDIQAHSNWWRYIQLIEHNCMKELEFQQTQATLSSMTLHSLS